MLDCRDPLPLPTADDLNRLVERQAVRIHALTLAQEELLARVSELVARNESLQTQLVAATAEKNALAASLETLRKESGRQAGRFRRRESAKIAASERKSPGQKPGHRGTNRPIPSHIDREIDVPLTECPQCRGAVQEVRERVQYVEEIPVVRPAVYRITTRTGTCPCCGPVASTHPLQTGSGHSASAVHLGPRAIALAATLNKQHGMSMRKTCRVLLDACGLVLSPGGLSQALDRLADRIEPEYRELFDDLRESPAVYVDETSWWVGGPQHWLWTFTSETTTLYQVRDNRGKAVVLDVLTPDFGGTLVSDCLNVYDGGLPYESKSKCIAHHQKAIREQLDSPGLIDRSYLEAWAAFFRQVCQIWHALLNMPASNAEAARKNLSARCDELLSREVAQPEDRKIRNRLQKQRPHLLTCLDHPGVVEPTNNRAERALRPAVIARKISCGNKTERGARTWERLVSVIVTWDQRKLNTVSELTHRASLTGYEG